MFADFLSEHPFQPATAFWRCVEVAEVAHRSLPSGLGLDLGCGDGRLTKVLLDRIGRRELVGVDIDPLETQQAASMAFYSRLHTCPASAIPEPSGLFDFAFSNSVLEHISPIKPVIQEVSRLLKPGGRFIMTVPSTSFHDCLRGPLFGFIGRTAYLKALDVRCAHRYYLDVEGWRGVLSECGLRLDVSKEYLNTAEVRRWETLSRFTGGLLYHLFGFLGKSRHPIEIQRSLGMRGGKMRLPKPAAVIVAKLLSSGISEQTAANGCLLLESVRE